MSQNTNIDKYKEYLEGLSESEIAAIVEGGRKDAETAGVSDDLAEKAPDVPAERKTTSKQKRKGKKKKSFSLLPPKKSKKKSAKGADSALAEAGDGSDENAPAAKPKRKLSEKEKTIRALKRLLRKIAVITVICVLLFTFVLGVSIHHDNNMFPAVRDGDLAILFKPGSAYNGDIVMYEVGEEKRLGRVVGIPGDTISIGDNGTYLINGTVPFETIYYPTHPAQGSPVVFPYTVKEGELFIFNDMREDMKDSRIFGGITEVKGKVVLLIRRRSF